MNFNEIIELIDERIDELAEKADKIAREHGTNNPGWGIYIGGHDELVNLREVLFEIEGDELVKEESV